VLALEQSLAPGVVDKTVKDRVARLGAVLDPLAVAIESNDALGLTRAMRAGMDVEAMQSLGVVVVMRMRMGCSACWMAVRAPVDERLPRRGGVAGANQDRARGGGRAGVQTGYTGSPAFQAEIGTGWRRT